MERSVAAPGGMDLQPYFFASIVVGCWRARHPHRSFSRWNDPRWSGGYGPAAIFFRVDCRQLMARSASPSSFFQMERSSPVGGGMDLQRYFSAAVITVNPPPSSFPAWNDAPPAWGEELERY